MSYTSPIKAEPKHFLGARQRPLLLLALGTLIGCGSFGPSESSAEALATDEMAVANLSKTTTTLSPASSPSLCLEPENGALKNGTKVYLVSCDQTSVQQWTVGASGTLKVGAMCLDVQDGANKAGTLLQLWECHKDNTNQKFDVQGGTVRWRNTDKCLDLAQGISSGSRLQIGACNSSMSSQAWKLATTAPAPTTPTVQPTPDQPSTTPAAGVTPVIANDQSGTGWGGADLLDPKSTATYRALSLDALLQKKDSMVAKQIGPQADIVAAIRRVTAETGVPSGLLASMIIQESNGDRNTSSDNPGYGSQPSDQRKDVGIIQSPLWRFEGATTAEKLKNAQDPYKNLTVFAQEAVQTYKKTGSWGQVAQVWYTGYIAERLGGVTGGSSQETNYVLNVLSHLAMGGTSYYPANGY